MERSVKNGRFCGILVTHYSFETIMKAYAGSDPVCRIMRRIRAPFRVPAGKLKKLLWMRRVAA
jgi:hypothetical protein